MMESALEDWEKMSAVGFNPLMATDPALFNKEMIDKVWSEVRGG